MLIILLYGRESENTNEICDLLLRYREIATYNGQMRSSLFLITSQLRTLLDAGGIVGALSRRAGQVDGSMLAKHV